MADFMAGENQRRGRPVQQLRFPLLPEVWEEHGVYGMQVVASDRLQILHTILHKHVILEVGELGYQAQDKAPFTIEQNWSEQRAVLVQAGCPVKTILMMLFVQGSSKSSSKSSRSSNSTLPMVTPQKLTRPAVLVQRREAAEAAQAGRVATHCKGAGEVREWFGAHHGGC